MDGSLRSTHALALCNPGSERWLKQEMAALRPELRAGFQRPGIVTFRAGDAGFGPDDAPGAVFARAWAASRGPVPEPAAIAALAAQIGVRAAFVGARDQGPSGAVPPAREAAAQQDAVAWRARLHELGVPTAATPAAGDLVLDVVTSPGEAPVVGWHRHGPGRHVDPCGRFACEPPAEAPSRAWRKVAEGLRWSGADLRPGEVVLEVGAAPGGSTLAFVERGALVIAVDPQPLAPALQAHPQVRWFPRPIAAVTRAELPPEVHWIACDANIAPARAIRAIRRLVPPFRRSLRGLLLTLKLNDDAVVATLPRLLRQVRELGAAEVRATQLPSNRRDLFVVAWLGRS